MKIWKKKPQGQIKNNTQNRKEERFILCIDGGGMRGVIPLAVLEHFEKILRDRGIEKNIASCFDLIAGTSTGGLIALSLSCKKESSIEEILNTYKKSGSTIFPQEQVGLFDLGSLRRLIAEKYPSTGIEKVLDSWFGDKKMADASVPVMAVSYDLSIGKETLIRSWKEGDFPVKEAGRATTAAPTYFSPLVKGSSILADGGIIANNPSVYAYYEAKKLYPDCKKFHILSLSTGAKIHTMGSNQISGILNWAEDILPLYSNAQKRLADYLLYNNHEVEYTRVDAPLSESIRMDDVSVQAMEKLENFGKDMALEYNELLLEFAEKLKRSGL